MPSSVDGLAVLDAEIRAHDWHAVRTFVGDASSIPEAVRQLVKAGSREAATTAYWRIDNVAMVDGRLSQSVGPLTSTLLVGLNIAGREGRALIIDLLANIAGGYDTHVDSDAVGPVPLEECIRLMVARLDTFVTELLERANPSSVDILLQCALHVDDVRARVIDIFNQALGLESTARVHDLLEVSLAEIS
jgi:hypothetical protein